MRITVNGEPRALPAGATAAEVVRALGRDTTRSGVALAVNGTVVPRARWDDAVLADGDRVEVVAAVQGGS